MPGRLHRLRGQWSRTGRIARWEVVRSASTVDRKTVAVLAAMLVVVGVVGISVAGDGMGLEDGIYVVGVDEESPYYEVAVESEQFRPVPLEDVEVEDGSRATVDIVVVERDSTADTGDGVVDLSGPSTRVTITAYGEVGDPAADAFRDAIEDHNDARMAREDDEAAAYPIQVTIDYRDRNLDSRSAGTESTAPVDGGGGTGADDGSGPGNDDTGAGDDDRTGATGDETADDGSGTTGGDGGSLQVPDVGGGAAADQPTPGTPGSISPPFPFESLVLAFLFVVPMNFVIQAYGSTIVDERVKRRGELLLVSPASRYEIVAGKTLPYLLGLVGVVVAIAYAVGGGPLSVAAAIPIALLFLAATFAGAMLARSFKELTFVTVTISVFLTTYTFIPAIFTDVNPIALISPLTLVVMDLQGDSVRLGEYLFSTGPFYCSAAVCFLLGIGLYREEDMFDQKPIPAKVVDAIAGRVRGYRSVPLLSILFIPFVFAAQLLAVALLFAVPETIALPAIVVVAAAIEEAAKSVHVYAGFARSRFDPTLRTAVVVGALSGAGFFVGEKVTHVAQLVGMPDLTVGVAAFGPELSSNPLVLVAVFLAPLVLHAVTAVVAAVGASRGPTGYAVGFVAATLVHAAYNVGVISLVA
nr:PrsW family intramembrane metalloprotease [Halosolutus amylolyticus]